MNIHKGTDRIVFVGERKAVKLPRVRGDLAFAAFNEMREDLGLREAWKNRKLGGNYSAQGHLTKGFEANRTEARLAKLHPEIVHATRGLLWGLVNVQDRAESLEDHNRDSIVGAFEGNLGDKTPAIGHILDDPSNFGQNRKGSPRILDAGSAGLGRLLSDKTMHEGVRETLSGLRH